MPEELRNHSLLDRFSSSAFQSGAIIPKQPEEVRECGFGVLPEWPQFVSRSTNKGGGVAVQSVDENSDDYAGLSGIDLGDRSSRQHPDQRVLVLVLSER
jgi:hypothetical protein